jgi:hypothetical protein
LEKAFQLAYFIVQDRSVAIDLVHRSLRKLTAQQSREKKRFYWRHKGVKRRTRKISRDNQDALQWLIYLESDRYEREQQQKHAPRTRSLAVQYIKYIMQMTGNMSSFYVAVGLYRILHNYTTQEIQNAYELVAADFVGTEKYRRVKKALMQKLINRFSGFINIRPDNQELRFEVDDNQNDWDDFVTVCLDIFTPWSTRNSCSQAMPGTFVAESARTTRLLKIHSTTDVEETKRCHIFIHPPCFDQLLGSLGLDPRSMRLSMPRFTTNQGNHFEDRSSRGTNSAPPLTEEERATLGRVPGASEIHPLRRLPKILTILADGVPCAQWDLSHETCKEWRIAEGTRLLEFYTEEEGANQLLAIHWIDYTDTGGIAGGEHTVSAGSGKELILKTIPGDPKSVYAGGAAMFMRIRLASPFARSRELLYSLLWSPKLLGYALVSMLVLFGWLWSIQRYQRALSKQQSLVEKLSNDRASAEAALQAMRAQQTPPIGEPVTYNLLPDSITVRGPDNTETPVLVLPRGAALVHLELPLYGRNRDAVYRATLKLFSSKTEVLQENLLKPKQTKSGLAVVFVLPSGLIEKQGRYVITLESMNAGNRQRVGDFSFYAHSR